MRYSCIFAFLLLLAAPAHAQQAWNVSLLCNWSDTAHIRDNGAGQRYSDVWGFVYNGKEYAALGSTEGVHIIDVDQCQQVAFHACKSNGHGISHRDQKTYGHYLYTISKEAAGALQIFDLSYLPDSLHLVYESNSQELAIADAIFIDTVNATLYVCAPRGLNGSEDYMRVYSIDTPDRPSLIVNYNSFDRVHTVYVRNDTAFCASAYYGYVIIDFSHHGSYTPVSVMPSYPYKGYCHSSWVDENNMGVMVDETFGSPLKVIDASQLPNLNVRGMCAARPGDSTSVAHNPYKLGYHALVSYYQDGLQIFDVSDPDNPQRVGYYHTYNGSYFQGYAGAWGCYPFLPSRRILVSDMQNGLYILDADSALNMPPLSLKKVATATNIKVFPNPVSDRILIQMPVNSSSTADISICDMTGRVQLSRSMGVNSANQGIELTLPGYWAKGTYIITVKTGGYIYRSIFTKS